MQVMPLGINYSTRKLLIDPMSSDQFGESILDALGGGVAKGAVSTRSATRGAEIVKELQRQGVDLGDPRRCGLDRARQQQRPAKSRTPESDSSSGRISRYGF